MEWNLIGPEHFQSQTVVLCRRPFEQPIVGGDKPSCRRLFGKREVQRIERPESDRGEFPCTSGCCSARADRRRRGVEPQSCGEPTVFTRVALVFEIMGRLSYEREPTSLDRFENGRHRFRFFPHSVPSGVIERSLETANVEIHSLTHGKPIVPRASRSANEHHDWR